MDGGKDRLLAALRLPVSVAERSIGTARMLSLVSTLAGVWITFFCIRQFGLSRPWWIILTSIAALPALHFIRLSFSLREITRLPERIGRLMVTTGGTAAGMLRSLPQTQDRAQAFKPSALLALGKSIREVLSLAGEYRDVTALLSLVLFLSNPLLMAISVTMTLLLLLVAGITLLVYLV